MGSCPCKCARPGDAHWAEGDDESADTARIHVREMVLQRCHRCEHLSWGEWIHGPLLPGSHHRFWGCRRWVLWPIEERGFIYVAHVIYYIVYKVSYGMSYHILMYDIMLLYIIEYNIQL